MPRPKKEPAQVKGQLKLQFPQLKKRKDEGQQDKDKQKKKQRVSAGAAEQTAQQHGAESGAGTAKWNFRTRAPPTPAQEEAQEPARQKQVTASPVQKKKKKAEGPKAKGALPQVLDSMELNGEVYEVGSDVYLVATDDALALPDDTAQDLCVACGKGHKPETIVECERCLGGYHMACLRPQLKEIPEGIWQCPCCERGEPVKRPLRTAYEKYLFAPVGQEVLQLARITSFAKGRSGPGSKEVCVRYYCRPESTHLGRQPHHATREVFLTSCEHWEPLECVFGSAVVCKPQDFDKQTGTEVYLCEYEYDEQWKRFRRCSNSSKKSASGLASKRSAKAWGATDDVLDDLRHGSEASGSEDEGSDFDAAAEASSSSDDEDNVKKDASFKPIYAFWAEKGMLGPKGYKGKILPKRQKPAPKSAALNKRVITLEVDESSDADEAGPLLRLVGQESGSASVPSRAPLPPLATARRALALASVPASLQCRDGEKAQIARFVQEAVEEGHSPGVLYVCGVPGTGKTAVISQVLKDVMQQQQQQMQQRLQEQQRQQQLQQRQQGSPRKAKTNFAAPAAVGAQVVSINALSLPSPMHVYSKLWEKLMGQRLGPGRALAALEQLFSSGSNSCGKKGVQHSRAQGTTLLVVDEIDVLITKDQSVLYNLFEWPTRAGAKLSVIGISNTHDLDERVLPRISSRLAAAKLAFHPYNVEALVKIIEQRLDLAGCKTLFKTDALTYASRKVAATTGDVRRALELLRRAAELAEMRLTKSGKDVSSKEALRGAVSMEHTIAAQNEMYSAPHMQFLKACSRLEKLVLASLVLEARASGKPSIPIQAIHHRLTTHVLLMCPLEAPLRTPRARSLSDVDLPTPPLGIHQGTVGPAAVCRVVQGLAMRHLIATSPSWQGIQAIATLAVHKDDVAAAVREDPSLTSLAAQL